MISINKPEGMTPLQALDALRIQFPEYKNETLSYAGRLDPMAQGVLPILVGEENKEREKHLGLDKEYEFEVLFGASTDTYDILGLATEVLPGKPREITLPTGTFLQPYPAYSSKSVDGTPLYQHARSGTLDQVEIPTKEVTIYSFEKLSDFEITGNELLANIKNRIGKVEGDFRQTQIIERWESVLAPHLNSVFFGMRFKARVSSGTYIRSLAVELGKQVRLPALAFSITRTSVGTLTLRDSLNIVSKESSVH